MASQIVAYEATPLKGKEELICNQGTPLMV